ncbi:hypothetical protein LTR09_008577 [Extremus antarcticus]|uniref:Oxidoreductase n=1 Tax=Extremus antarcticus TaxID=702011 RepID=A0AAJ0G669_9PEZI|nr:hypothetical protein LTR09_008577 [Extremus antarcticus]
MIVACEEARLVYLIDPVFAARDAAEAFEVPLFPSVAAMLEHCKPDAAIVSTPNSTHVAVSKELLSGGMNVLVEKPISVDSSTGDDLVTFANERGMNLLVGNHRWFNGYIDATKTALEEGLIGTPLAVSGLWMLCKPKDYFQPPTQWRASAEGGGVVLINMIHEVDILQYLLGPITRAHAEQMLPQRGHEAEEGAAILIRFASGVVGTFLLCDSTPSQHNFESSTGENPIIPHAGADCYRIFGTEGTLSVGGMKVTSHRATDEHSWSNTLTEDTLSINSVVPFDQQIEHFIQVIKGKEAPRCNGVDGVSALRVCESIKKAMKEGVSVDVASAT